MSGNPSRAARGLAGHKDSPQASGKEGWRQGRGGEEALPPEGTRSRKRNPRLRETTSATKKAAANKMIVPANQAEAKDSTTTAKAPANGRASAARMTKTQLIRYMAEQMEVPPRQITAFFDLLIQTATTETRKNGEFTIPGLGKMVQAQPAARMGRNPATGEAIMIKAKTTVKFRIDKAAKDAVVPLQ